MNRDLKGRYIKGHKLSKETQFKKGSKPKHAGKSRPNLAGKKHWNWKDRKNYRPTVTFKIKELRKNVWERDDYLCLACGGDKKLRTHHLQSWFKYPKLRYKLSNVITLCNSCHASLHYKQRKLDGSGKFLPE